MQTLRFVATLAVPVLLSAAVATAAGLDVGSGLLASGRDSVHLCDPNGVHVTYGPVIYDSAIPGRKITTVTVSGVAQPGCRDRELRLALSATGGAPLGLEKVVPNIDSMSAMTFDFTDEKIKAEDVVTVHVLLVGP